MEGGGRGLLNAYILCDMGQSQRGSAYSHMVLDGLREVKGVKARVLEEGGKKREM